NYIDSCAATNTLHFPFPFFFTTSLLFCRNMEKRRETSRFAARDRRGRESEIFSDLRAVVPIVDEGTVTHLDRIAVLRVSSAWCRMRKTAANVLKPIEVGLEVTPIGKELWCEDTITETLDGFVIIADSDGTILCVTESVCLYLGLSQVCFSLTSFPLIFKSLFLWTHLLFVQHVFLIGRLWFRDAYQSHCSISPTIHVANRKSRYRPFHDCALLMAVVGAL
ncbi:hypothetical protein GCK32_020667, partial [Trichostrongylus colubriformis]